MRGTRRAADGPQRKTGPALPDEPVDKNAGQQRQQKLRLSGEDGIFQPSSAARSCMPGIRAASTKLALSTDMLVLGRSQLTSK
jgi:hypothetical protein